MSNHIRNTGAMLTSPHCGAKTRTSAACREGRQINVLLSEARKLLDEIK